MRKNLPEDPLSNLPLVYIWGLGLLSLRNITVSSKRHGILDVCAAHLLG